MNSNTYVRTTYLAEDMIRERNRSRWKMSIAALFAALLAVITCLHTGFSVDKMREGMPAAWDLMLRMFPPELNHLKILGRALLETLQMAFVATVTAAVLSLSIGLVASDAYGLPGVVKVPARLLLNFLRTIPELLWALLLVSAVGLGAFTGVIALTLHTIGGLGKLYADVLDEAGEGSREAVRSCGASRWQIVTFALLPETGALLASTTLNYWDSNNRAATVLGLVGAGGIGLELTQALQAFRYPEATTCIILIILVLAVSDRFSALIRHRMF